MAYILENKARIYKQADGSIRIGPSCYIDDTLSTPVLASKYEYVENFEVDRELVVNVHNEQVELDRGVFTIDQNWERNLMPITLIKAKHIENLGIEIDSELNKGSPDIPKAIKLQRDKEKAVVKYPDPSWYPIALANLDARVAKGEEDKPIIRSKLQIKILENSIKGIEDAIEK